MEYTKLGNSDLTTSRICMGCMGFGEAGNGQHSWTVDEEDSRKIIKKGLELGINFFDTAIAYQSGTSEQYLGRAIRDFANRDDVVIATKFLPRTNEEIEAGISGQKHIEKMLDKSLQNLGMDYVDLYIYHMWDYNTPLYDIMEGLNHAIKSGKTRYIGISNCFAYQLAKANAIAEKYGFTKFVSVQGHYNLIFREEEREMAKFCLEENIAMTPYSPLAGGRLAKRPGETSKRLLEDSYAHLKYDATAEQDGIIIDRVEQLADKYGVSMTEISLAWLFTKVSAPVVGTTKLHHIEDAAKAVNLTLTADELAFLEEPYLPHKLVGVMAQNTPASAKEQHVWSTGNQKI
ncbi:aldo/keto reductase [Negativibacillus massiliensis]|uniref:aldo/keto reductase n=1 Tax=Negativibacillus massiliensis TaxID=1871035 RepID=UPI003AF66708